MASKKDEAKKRSEASKKAAATRKANKAPEKLDTDQGPVCEKCGGTTRFEGGTCPDCDPGQS